MKSVFLPKWLGFLLSFLSGISPISFVSQRNLPAVTPATVHVQKITSKSHPSVVKVVHQGPIVGVFHPVAPYRQYTCLFEGTVGKDGVPFVHARVSVRVISSRQHIIQDAYSDAQGHYQLAVPLYARINEPLTWEMTAQTPDYHLLEASGGQILQNDGVVKIQAPLDFPAI